MKQSRIDSLMESLTNIFVGLFVSTIANWIILPAVLGVSMTLGENLLIGLFFTVVSITRSYVIRRAFNGRSVWKAVSEPWWWRCAGCHRRAPLCRGVCPGRQV